MKVFIMWSGDRSKHVAIALRGFLESVIQRPDYFISTDDIQTGAVWDKVIAGQLEETHFGIACLTKESLGSTWIHFEAGAISKVSNNAIVVPYLIDIESSDVTGPLTKFQAAIADNQGTLRLVESINEELPINERKSPKVVHSVFEALWPQLEKTIADSAGSLESEAQPIRSENDILREILDRVRMLERKITSGIRISSMDQRRGIPESYYESSYLLDNKLILWVDDNPTNNIPSQQFFERAGAKIEYALSTEDALSIIREKGLGGFDLVITDMGRGSNPRAGVDLLRELGKMQFPAPVIVFSTSNEVSLNEVWKLGGESIIEGHDNLIGEVLRLFSR
jgi:CheY-like chemotaxis protein